MPAVYTGLVYTLISVEPDQALRAVVEVGIGGMPVFFLLYIILFVLSAVLSAWLSYYAWQRRAAPGAASLSVITAAVALWLLGYALELTGGDLAAKLFWGKLQYAGIVTLPVAWLVFALKYMRRSNSFARNMVLLAVVPLITLGLAVTNEAHGLIWSTTTLKTVSSFSILEVTHGAWFWVHSLYSYLLLLAGTGLIIREFFRRPQLYRWQAAALIAAVLAPWISNALYLLKLSPVPQLDITPFGFAFTGLMFSLSLFGLHLFELVPIARAAVLESMRDGVLVLDAGGRLIDINPAAAVMLARTPEQALGKTADELLGPQFTHTTARLALQGSSDQDGSVSLGVGEQRRDLDVRVSPLRDSQGQQIGHLLVLRDVTATRQAEEVRQKLTALIEYSSDFIGMADLDGKVIFLNQSGCQLVGLGSIAEACTHVMYDFIVEADLRLFKEQILPEVLRAGACSGEIRFRHFAGGEQIPMQFTIFLVRNAQTGMPMALASVSRDITEQKRAEQQLRAQSHMIAEQHRRLHVVSSAISDGTILIGGDRRILVINDAALQLLSLPGGTADWVDQPIDQLIEQLHLRSSAAAAVGLSEMYRVELGDTQKRSGEQEIEPYVIHWESRPIQPDAMLAGRMVVLRDVTEEHALQRMRDDLTHTMVHDLRNPLTAIQGALDVLRFQHTLDCDTLDMVDIARRASRRMIGLVTAILDMSRLESGQMPLNHVSVPLPELVAEIVRLFAPLSEVKHLQIQSRAPADLPMAWADYELIGRVLQNLIGNAIKFTPEFGTITVTIMPSQQDEGSLLVSISDTGMGIPAELQGRIFQKFVTGSASDSGSGLGLAFCKLAVEAHGGKLWLERRPEPGTTFCFTVPASTAAMAAGSLEPFGSPHVLLG